MHGPNSVFFINSVGQGSCGTYPGPLRAGGSSLSIAVLIMIGITVCLRRSHEEEVDAFCGSFLYLVGFVYRTIIVTYHNIRFVNMAITTACSDPYPLSCLLAPVCLDIKSWSWGPNRALVCAVLRAGANMS